MKTVINIKSDKELKEKAQRVAKELGLPLGTIINNYLRHFTQEQRVTFVVPEIPNKRTGAILRQASRDYKAGRNIVGPFKTGAEMDAYLDS